MGFLQRLRQALGLDPAAGLRRRVEAAIARDELKPLADLLRREPEAGKDLIRAYQDELRSATGPGRETITRRITALVAVYARVLDDPEPLSWFRAPAARSETRGDVALDQARQAFSSGDFAGASRVASEGLSAIAEDEGSDGPGVREGLASSLHAVRGAAAVHLGRLGEAKRHFEQSLEHALRSGSAEAQAAARLNLLDVNTRIGVYPTSDPALEETVAAATGSRYEDVAGKLFVERGVSLAARGEIESAIRVFDRVLELRPEWPFPLYHRAWARFLQGDSGGALDDYREVATRHPIFFTVQREIRCLEDVAAGRLPIEAYRSFCVMRERLGTDAAGTVVAAQRMVERHPDFAPGWLLLAEGLLAQGNRSGARDATREALRRDPDADTASAALFAEWNLARAAGEPEAMKTAAERLRSAYPGHPATAIVERLGNTPDENRVIRWTWSLDGTLSLEEVPRGDGSPPGSAG